MGWSGKIKFWLLGKQAAIVREHNRKEEEDYLKELKKETMTAAYGIGMFGYNMVCLLIGLLIIYYVINKIK